MTGDLAPPARPACCAPKDKLDSVAQLMVEHDCGEIPVCEGFRVVGVVTDRDITCRAVAAGMNPALVPVREVMTKAVHTVLPKDPIDAAMELMEEHRIRHVPVPPTSSPRSPRRSRASW